MSLLKLLLSSLILLIAIDKNADGWDTAFSFCLSQDVEPKYYNITLGLYMDMGAYIGFCNVCIRIRYETQTIKMYLNEMELVSNTLTDNFRKAYKSETHVDNKTHIVTFQYNDKLLPGDYKLGMLVTAVAYYPTSALLNTSYINEKGDSTLFTSRIFTIGTRSAFPCWDKPILKAIFNICVCHLKDEEYIALSNMPTLRTANTISKCTVFHDTPKISPYLVGIVVLDSSYAASANFSIRCRSHLIPYLNFANFVVQNVTRYFQKESNYFKPNMSQSVIYVAIPSPENSLANWKLVLYREADIIYDPKLDSIEHAVKVAHSVARGVAYQWFGNQIDSTRSYMWLNEGISTLLAADAIAQIVHNWHTMNLFAIEFQQESLRFDTDSIMKPLIFDISRTSERDLIFSFSHYIKAPSIMRMLQYILTPEVFRKGIGIYMSNHTFYSANLDHFCDAMETAYRESNPYLHAKASHIKDVADNIASDMFVWAKQEHYPVLNVTRIDSESVLISISNMKLLGDYWSVPLTLTTQTHANFNFPKTWISLRKTKNNYPPVGSFGPYPLKDEDGWIIVNLQQIGYYRVNYEFNNWYKIAAHLWSEEYRTIHVLNRAQIIDDAFYFLMTNELKLSLFLRLVDYLWQETEYVVWYPMFKAFEYISCFFPFEESQYIKGKMLLILEEFYIENEYIINSPDRSLGTEIIRWRCAFGSFDCMMKATEALQKTISSSNKFILPPGKEWIYCTGLKMADITFWNVTLGSESRNEVLKYATCSTNRIIVYDLIERILLKDYNKSVEQSERHDYVNSFHSLVARHARDDIMLVYILEHLEKIKPKEIDTFVALTDIINHVYSDKELDTIKKYMESNTSKEIKYLTETFKDVYEFSYRKITEKDYTLTFESALQHYLGKYIKKKILPVKNKIELRSTQIAKQKEYFNKLIIYRTKC